MRRLTSFVPRARLLAGAAALLALSALPLHAQSLFSFRGLGLPLEPLSARAQGLGGVGLGLGGIEISWADPAAAVGLPAPGFTAAFNSEGYSAEVDGIDATGHTVRFPFLMAAFPFGQKWAVTAGFGSFLDQNWRIESNDTLLVEGDSVPVLDRLASDGGVSRLRLAAAYQILPKVAISLGGDLFTGSTTRTTGRLFPGQPTPPCCTANWTYHGTGAVASVNWTPNAAASVAVGVSGGGTLRAETDDSLATDARYDLPVELSLGASARVAQDAVLAASAKWAGWSSLDGALAGQGGAHDAWSVNGGVEWQGLQLFSRPLPLRLGGSYRQLPFRWSADSAWPTEKAVTAGFGLELANGAASTDFAVERGSRGGAEAGLDESFWRLVVSVRILGR